MIRIETNRLVIRNFQSNDAPALRQTILKYSASEYAKYDHQWPTSEEEFHGVVGWFAGGDNFLAVCLKESGQFIGFIALNKTEKPDVNEYDLGYVFNADYYGHGYATEGSKAVLDYAFSSLRADQVTGNTALKNGPSCRLLARLGMRKIGESTGSFQQTPDGKPIEFIGGTFVLTRKDWAFPAETLAQNAAENSTVRHPELSDAQAALDLLNLCDIAEYGESDSSLDDLIDEWSDIDLSQDAWLVFTPQNQLTGYAAVFASGQQYSFDFYVHPTLAPAGLARHLLKLCEDRANEQLKGSDARATAVTIVSQVNQANRQTAEQLGYQVRKYYFGMRISFDAPPPLPVWPEGITLRNAVAGQDDRLIYNFIQTAFDRPGRVRPAFERWRDFMVLATNFDSDLWFLAYHGEELVGAILCFDYPQYGWVRQLGVAGHWRGKGLGSALLQHMFGIFYQRGHTTIGLGVDSENPNAYHLYERIGMKRARQYIEYDKNIH